MVTECEHEVEEFISPIFLRPKGKDQYRMILNLKEFNKNLETIHFKMDTIYSVLDLITPNCYMGSIDLKDAYYSVPIDDAYQKYFKFVFNNTLYKFLCLPNGYCHGPRKFTKLLKPVLALLRLQGHILAAYIDDMLNIGSDYDECVRNIIDTIYYFTKLGFNIHPEKSCLVPAQEIVFLGFVINSVKMTVQLTLEKKVEIRNMSIDILKNPYISIRALASFIGKITASFPGVRCGPLHYRNLERDKCDALKLNKGNFDKCMYVKTDGLQEILWWKDNVTNSFANIFLGNPDIIIETDACPTGWGAVFNEEKAHGGWKMGERDNHINVLELRAILLGLKTHTRGIKNKHILVKCDNMTAVCGMNKMGSVRSAECDEIIREIWEFIIENENWITVSYIPGKENLEADAESRVDHYDNKEWMLDRKVFTKLMVKYTVDPKIDLFASRLNYQLKPFMAFKPDPEALCINSFTIDWATWSPFYAFPPFLIITKVLQKVQEDRAEGIIIIPYWPNQIWFPIIMRMITKNPIILPSRKHLLHQPQSPELHHPLLPKMKILACYISGNLWKSKEFLAKSQSSSLMDGVMVNKIANNSDF